MTPRAVQAFSRISKYFMNKKKKSPDILYIIYISFPYRPVRALVISAPACYNYHPSAGNHEIKITKKAKTSIRKEG